MSRSHTATLLLLAATLVSCDDDAPAEPPRGQTEPASRPAAADDLPVVQAHGIRVRRLEGATVEDQSDRGVGSVSVVLPSHVRFAVISSPPEISPEEALAIQLANARRAGHERGGVLEDGDAPSRRLAGAIREGKRVVHEVAGAAWHTEVFAFSAGERTVVVVIELPDPADAHEDIVATLGESLLIEAP